MFVEIRTLAVYDRKKVVEALCTSNDVKPVGAYHDQSICTETDTGDTYYYDAAAGVWKPFGGEE